MLLLKSPEPCFDMKIKHYAIDQTQKHTNIRSFQVFGRLFHSLQHIFGSVTAQVIGHSISTVQGRFHIQAANEILGAILVEV